MDFFCIKIVKWSNNIKFKNKMKFLNQIKIDWKKWKYKIIFIAIAILLSALILFYTKNGANNNYQQEISTETAQKDETRKQSPGSSSSAILSYNEAVLNYEDRRIQFDPNCVVSPGNVVFKRGTKIMLDNRYEKARSVYLDGQKYSLGAYGFKIVTLTTTAQLPHTIKIDCGTGKNNGQILLQQ